MKNIIYKIKENTELSKFEELGYSSISFGANQILIKIVPQDINSDLPQAKLKCIYTNPEWIKQFYKPNKKKLKEELGLKYHKNGQINYTDKFKQFLTDWRIQIDTLEDGWVGVTSLDRNDMNTYYNKTILDKYFKEEIDKLIKADLIEELEVEGE